MTGGLEGSTGTGGSQDAGEIPSQDVRKVDLDHASYAHRQYETLAVKNSDSRIHKTDYSGIASRDNHRSAVVEPNFNLPSLFPDFSSSHRPSRFPPPYGTPSPPPIPEFGSSTPTNISAQHGSNIFLQCRIKNLSNQSRTERATRAILAAINNSRLLTKLSTAVARNLTTIDTSRQQSSPIVRSLDQVTFIADERFHVFQEPDSGSWSLQIRYVQARDGGTYECQVSSEPKISHFVHFTVVSECLMAMLASA
ncbi:hypothetical protein HAZT_HAZT011379 [Hyalella azteca]|uniref:Ig-like domain-containing protein n=1 Tax=Hyalella azteca TaxID=294128 RepID=A0A6A0GS38_HYAAZ|nr:hypothetical protein HAZT_HAZT011379 [Hyalella azteca]